MKRLAIYAHFGTPPQVATHVLFHLRHLAELGCEICFVSNSEIGSAGQAALKVLCRQIGVRPNIGLDFAMWQRALAEYNLARFDELILTNSSIIGPVQPLAPLWQNPAVAGCDFWSLTDNDEWIPHFQSYFLVFGPRVLHSPRFKEFWRGVLPYHSRLQVIHSYELGLSTWLVEGGFTGKAVFSQAAILSAHRASRNVLQTAADKRRFLAYLYRQRTLPPRDVTRIYPDLLLAAGMPYLKAAVLRERTFRMSPALGFALLEKYGLPPEILADLRREFPAATGPQP
jgi:lipopolysaccharide biosynthesis protein